MGRAPCCDKANVKRGPWSPEEDAKLKSYIEQHGTGGNWIALPQKIGLKRCGKSCRLRWLNYLRPNIKHGGFSEEEDRIICSLYVSIGSRWSVIAAQLPGRTDNDIKNYWNTRLKKKLLGKHRKDQQARRGKITSTAATAVSLKQQQQQQQQMNDYNNNSASDENTWPHLPIPQHTHPYWPHMPVPPPLPYSISTSISMTSQLPSQDSLRNLLIKLGGRFSDHDHHIHQLYLDEFMNFQLPHGATPPSSSPSPLQLPNYDEQQLNMVSSSSSNSNSNSSAAATSINSIIHTHTYNHQPLQSSTDQSHYSGINLVQAAAGSCFTQPPLEHMSLSDDPTSLQGLEFLYAPHNMIHEKIIGPTPSSCDTHTNSMLYPPLLASSYDSMPLHFPFQHS